MKLNSGQTIVEVAALLFIAVVIICFIAVIVEGNKSKLPCDNTSPTAGQIVDCIGTRTAEAHNK